MKTTGSLNLSKHHKENFITGIYTISKALENSEKPNLNETIQEPLWKCRYVVTLVSFASLLLVSIHRTIMGITIVAMVNNTALSQVSEIKSQSCLELIPNSTEETGGSHNSKQEGVFIWSPKIQGYILGCVWIGQIAVLIPASTAAQRFGGRSVLLGSLLMNSILTMLIPFFAWISASAVIGLQIFRGIAQGMAVPCVTILMSNWTPKKERGVLCGIMQTAHFLGPVVAFIFGGFVSESPGGWPSVFYYVGGVGLLLVLCVLFLLAEIPGEHSGISKAELDYILSQQESKLSRRRPKVPWRQILTSVPVYALTISVFGRYWEFTHFWSVHSIFLGTILHYPIGENGILSASPNLLGFLTSLTTAFISGYIEKKEAVSVNFLRKFLILSSAILYSLCLFGIYMAGCNRNLSISFTILSMGAAGMSVPAQCPVYQDMSPTFAGTLQSVSGTIGSIASVLLPLTVGYITNGKQTIEQWNKVFFIGIGVIVVSKIIFTVYGSLEIQPWNFVEDEDGKKKNEQSQNGKTHEESLFWHCKKFIVKN